MTWLCMSAKNQFVWLRPSLPKRRLTLHYLTKYAKFVYEEILNIMINF
jgi:hypothetical protein